METAELRTPYRGYAVKFNPRVADVVLAATAHNFITTLHSGARVADVGGGLLHFLAHDPIANTLNQTHSFPSPAGLYDCSWSPDGVLAATGGANGHVSIWDPSRLPSENPVHTFVDHLYDARSVDWNPDDFHALLSASLDGCVKLWDLDRRCCVRTFGAQHHPDIQFSGFYSVHWNPSQPHVFAAGSSHVLHDAAGVFDSRTGSRIERFPHLGSVVSIGWHHRDQHLLATTASDQRVRLWDMSYSAVPFFVAPMEGFVGRSRVRFAPDHDSGFVTCSGKAVFAWDYQSVRVFEARFDHHTEYATGVDVSPRVAGLMASTGVDDKVVVWPTRSSERVMAVAERDKGGRKSRGAGAGKHAKREGGVRHVGSSS